MQRGLTRRAAQRLIFIAMLGRYSRFLMRLLSVGHMFLINVIYATAVLINALACIWCAALRQRVLRLQPAAQRAHPGRHVQPCERELAAGTASAAGPGV